MRRNPIRLLFTMLVVVVVAASAPSWQAFAVDEKRTQLRLVGDESTTNATELEGNPEHHARHNVYAVTHVAGSSAAESHPSGVYRVFADNSRVENAVDALGCGAACILAANGVTVAIGAESLPDDGVLAQDKRGAIPI